MSSGWGCPHETKGLCKRMNRRPCDPGMRGCILHGRFTFSNDSKNRPAQRTEATPATAAEDKGA